MHKQGALARMLPNWRVLEIAPVKKHDPWVYLSLGTWEVTKDELHQVTIEGSKQPSRYGLDFLITSPVQDRTHIKTLAWVAFYHANPRYRLNLGHTIEIGDPWLAASTCDHFLVSMPYPYPPELETIKINDIYISFWWLLPITKQEALFAYTNGAEALEELFEKQGIDYLNVNRRSVV